jgi:ADP-ribose pyrophosphatase YjhB (NUDIX family)
MTSTPNLRTNIKPKAMAVIRRTQNGRTQILATAGVDTIKGEKFYRLIGGHIEFGETASSCLSREITEELGPDIQVHFSGPLRWVDNIFTYNGSPGHEVIALCDGTVAHTESIRETYAILDCPDVYAEWVDEADAKAGNIKLYPHGCI